MNKKHFTLVEVLVVVGIIGILAGLIFPAVGMARQAAMRTECVSNQGQLAKLLTITMNANDNYLVSGNSYEEDSSAPAWTRYLYNKGKLQDLKGFRCPALLTKQPSSLQNLGNDLPSALEAALGVIESTSKPTNQKFNGFDFRGTKLLNNGAETISANQLVLGGCSGEPQEEDSLEAYITSKASIGTSSGKFLLIHSNDFNMFFLDGHVESANATIKDKDVTVSSNKYIPKADGTQATLIPSDLMSLPEKIKKNK